MVCVLAAPVLDFLQREDVQEKMVEVGRVIYSTDQVTTVFSIILFVIFKEDLCRKSYIRTYISLCPR